MMDILLSWLAAPLSGSATHEIAELTSCHARLMVLAGGVLLPLGAAIARFYKVTPHQDWPNRLDNKMWWNTHRWMQGAAVMFMTVGLVLALDAGRSQSTAAAVHRWCGWLLCISGWLQVLAGLWRGSKGGPTDKQLHGDHYEMSPRRRWFERLHKGLGWLAIAVAIPTIAIGLVVSDAPRWMAVVLTLWWLVLGAACMRLQAMGRCMDTYQAIWGPDKTHPGNHITPVGWGVRRYTAHSWRERFGNRTKHTL